MWAPLGRHQACSYSDPLPQGLPFQQLHGNERLTLVLTNVVNCADIGMIERTRGTRLALEALLGLTILLERLGQKLQGNESLFRVQRRGAT